MRTCGNCGHSHALALCDDALVCAREHYLVYVAPTWEKCEHYTENGTRQKGAKDMFKVEILDATEQPLEACGRVAGISYRREGNDERRAINCAKAGHMAALEFADVTFKVEGISRACSHQLVRHRHGSYMQDSQRHVDVPVFGDWYVTPPDIEGEALQVLDNVMMECAYAYTLLVNQYGVKLEDARFVLPTGVKTTVAVRYNVRALFELWDKRMLDKSAQWEIRDVCETMFEALRNRGHGWEKVTALYEEIRGVKIG